MPDDENIIDLFYRDTMLAFETPSEVILKGTPNGILKELSLVDEHTFRLSNSGREYTLRPLYEIHEKSYGAMQSEYIKKKTNQDHNNEPQLQNCISSIHCPVYSIW